jgi:hypothetical protein
MSTERRWTFVALANWMVLVKLTKLLPLFRAHPSDICFIPFAIGFGYFHGFIKYYALLTLKNVGTFPSLTTPKLTASRLPGAAVTQPTQMLDLFKMQVSRAAVKMSHHHTATYYYTAKRIWNQHINLVASPLL